MIQVTVVLGILIDNPFKFMYLQEIQQNGRHGFYNKEQYEPVTLVWHI